MISPTKTKLALTTSSEISFKVIITSRSEFLLFLTALIEFVKRIFFHYEATIIIILI